MSIPKFETFTSGAVPVRTENIDTDQIIPARFLKATERKGFGDNLFRVVSSFFADIFRNNALNNGLLPITVSNEFLAAIFAAIDDDPAARFTVDLDRQTLTAEATGRSERFEIDAYKKRCLQNGYDDVDYLCSISDQIRRFEEARK